MTSIDLRVIAPALTDHFHCMHCEQMFMRAGIGQQVHRSQMAQYPQEMIEQSAELAQWLHDLLAAYQDQLKIQLIDPMSLKGFLLSLRYGVRKYPAFILGGHKVYTGWNHQSLKEILDEYVHSTSSLGHL
jgi:hypothetical protein